MVYQRTGVTDPKESQRKKHLSTKNEKVTPHTVKIEKGSLLRRSGVSFRSEAVENATGRSGTAQNAKDRVPVLRKERERKCDELSMQTVTSVAMTTTRNNERE